jgi:hypothetical protein
MKARLVFTFGLCGVVALFAGPVGADSTDSHSEPARETQRVSHNAVSTLNWSGYAVYKDASGGTPAMTFSDVKAAWLQPSVVPGSCPTRKLQLAAFFVGIDGDKSNTVEQIGTEADCVNGSATYFAWYEMYPAGAVIVDTSLYPVAGGDSLSGEVSFGSGQFTLSLHNATAGWTFSTIVSAPGPTARTSAEWIAEAPATGGHFWPLTNFDSITFTSASVTGNGTVGVIHDSTTPANTPWDYDSITMVSRGRPFAPTIKAAPGALNTTGNGFTITRESG